MTTKRSVLYRLLQYAGLYKNRIALALLVLCAAVGAELAGPYLGKLLIDRHVGSILHPWYEWSSGSGPEGTKAVQYRGNTYVRSDWIVAEAAAAAGGREVRIVQADRSMYLIRQPVKETGGWTDIGGGSGGGETRLRVSDGAVSAEYAALRLSAADVVLFYSEDTGPALRLLGLYMALLLAASALHYVQGYTLQSTAHRIIQRMRMDLMRHIQRIPVRYFDNTPIGQVVSRIANDTEAIRDLFMSFMATFVVSGINIVGIYVALFILDTKLALLSLLFIPLFAVVMTVHLKFSQKYVSVMRARLSDMNAMLSESIQVMPMLQAFRREKERREEFEGLNEDRYVNNVKQFRIFSLSSRNFTGLVRALFTAGIIWYFGGQSLHTAISFGVFYAFIDYIGRFFQPIIGIFDQMLNAQRAIVSAEKVFAILDMEGTELAAADDAVRPEGSVKFDRVSFGYNAGDYVLRDITFEAKRGETVALVGHTGSGKSSIMNLLLGFYEPSGGVISIDGESIAGKSKQELRKHMGVVLQDPYLFAGDIAFNVSLHNKGIGLEQVKEALRAVGADTFIEKLPGGYNEPVVERGSTLSAGQRQLISFARALAFDPAILILDEATSSIDSETEGLIQNALQVLSRGRTTFVIAHRLSTIRAADQILVLHHGEIVERGTHDELMQLKGRYYTMYQLQSSGQGDERDAAPGELKIASQL